MQRSLVRYTERTEMTRSAASLRPSDMHVDRQSTIARSAVTGSRDNHDNESRWFPEGLARLGGFTERSQKEGGTQSLVGLSDNLRGDTLSDCFFSLRKKSPNPHVCAQCQRLACPVIIFNRIHGARSDTPMYFTQASTIQENCIILKLYSWKTI